MRKVAGVIAALAAAGCVSHDDASSAAIRMLNAVPDAPRMNLLIDGREAYVQIDYRSATPFVVRAAGTHDIQVEEIMPGGDAVVIDLPDTELTVGQELSLLVIGKIAAGTVEAWALTSTTRGVAPGKTRLRVAHAAPDAPRVDVYVTDSDTVLTAAAPFATLRYKQASPQRELKSGAARIRLTAVGDPATVLFDSGTVSLPLERDLLVVAVESVAPDTAPVQLVVLNNTGTSASLAVDTNAVAQLRIVNASADSYPLDVTLDDGTEGGLTTVASALAFPGVAPGPSTYTTVAPGSYTWKTLKSGDVDTVPLQFSVSFGTASSNTFILGDAIAELGRVALPDDPRRVITEARLRLVHASPAAEQVDIYIVQPGADLNDQTADFANVLFGASTGYVARAPGSYEVILTKAGSKTDILLTLPVTVVNGGIYTAVVTDKAGGGLPVEIIRLDDL